MSGPIPRAPRPARGEGRGNVDAIVIDRAELPKPEIDPDDGRLYAHARVGERTASADAPLPSLGRPSNDQTPDWHRASALAHLALAEYLAAHPPTPPVDDETGEVARLRQFATDRDQEAGMYEHQRDAARAERDVLAATVARVEALADGHDHHLILSAEPVRTEVWMDGSSPYGLRYTGEVGAIALVYQTPDAADRLRGSLAVQPHVSVARIRAALHPEKGTDDE